MYRLTIPELFRLVEKINKRHVVEHRMSLSIAQNHRSQNPQKLWDALALPSEEKVVEKPAKFDDQGFEILKMKMRQNPRMIVK